MHPFKFLAFVAFAYFSLVVIFGSGGDSPPETTVKVPQTVQIVPLTDEQIADQEALIARRRDGLAQSDRGLTNPWSRHVEGIALSSNLSRF